MVLMARTWWASEPITAEMMPAPSMPASQTGAVVVQQTQQDPSGSGILPSAAKPKHPEKNAGQPDDHDGKGIGDDRALEGGHAPGGKAHDGHVRKHDGGERDQGVAPKGLGRHLLAGDEEPAFWIARQLADVIAKAERQGVADDRHRDGTKTEEENGLKNVDPDGPAHPAEKHIGRHHHRHDGAAEGVGNQRMMGVRV